MSNIGKVSGIDAKLGDTSRQVVSGKKPERTKAKQQESFSDIYDVRLLSAELNRSSSEFKLAEVREANSRLREVIKDIEEFRTEDIVTTYPSEDIIELSKMAKKS